MKIPFAKQVTNDYFTEARAKGLSWINCIHGYIYGKYCYQYIGMAGDKAGIWKYLFAPIIWLIDRQTPFFPKDNAKVGDPGQKRPTWSDTYHGKAMPVQDATKLVKLDHPVDTAVSEQVLPYTRARDIVLKNPDTIVVLDCPCRSGMKNPCKPLDVCLIIGEPMASFMLEHHDDKAREITPDEAVRILKAENARGHVAHAFFKELMLDRFYAICNCCSCCCGAMKAQRSGIQMLCSSGYLAEVDEEACVACGVCAEKCQFRAIGFRNGHAFIRAKRCMGCGVCVEACSKDALSLRLAPEKGEPLVVEKL